jgi:hypothetical protein
MSAVATWTPATLLEGRVQVGNRVRFQAGDEQVRGVVCETEQRGHEHPRAVVEARLRTYAVELVNVAPGACQKTPRNGAQSNERNGR